MTLRADFIPDSILNGRTLWLACASFLAGMLNSVAGGGSFLSFPALLHLRLPPIQANATNTVALWPGQLTSIAGYRRDFGQNRRLILPFAVAAAVGGVVGAFVLLHTSQRNFLRLVPWLLLAAATIFAISGPLSRRLEQRARTSPAAGPSRVAASLGVLLVSCYIGYFGAGGGFVLLALLALCRVGTLHQMNALKVVSTTVANGAAVLLFLLHGDVLWQYGLLMMLTGAVGGYVGARNARRVPPTLMRVVVTILGFSVAAYFFWRNGR